MLIKQIIGQAVVSSSKIQLSINPALQKQLHRRHPRSSFEPAFRSLFANNATISSNSISVAHKKKNHLTLQATKFLSTVYFETIKLKNSLLTNEK